LVDTRPAYLTVVDGWHTLVVDLEIFSLRKLVVWAGVATRSPSLVVVLADPACSRDTEAARVGGEHASRVRFEGRRPRHLLRLGFLIRERRKVAVTKQKDRMRPP
jgi:hypothetical protein